LADATANVTLTRSYAPYGDTLTSTGVGTTAWQFAGEQRDASGLTFLRARYLSTATGRFITQDEWPGEAQRPATLHPYLYGLNNPIRYTDPSGRCVSGAVVDTILCGALIGGVIGVVGGGAGYWLTHRDGNWNQRDFANAIVVGGVSGIVGGAVGGGVGALFGTATLGQAIVGGAVSGALSGAATQFTANLWHRYVDKDLCVGLFDNVGQAAIQGAVTGAVTGGVGYGVARYLRNRYAVPASGFTPEEATKMAPVAYTDFSGLKGADAKFIRAQVPENWTVKYSPYTTRGGTRIDQWLMTSPDGMEQLRLHGADPAFGETGFQARWGIQYPETGQYGNLVGRNFRNPSETWLYFNNRGVPVDNFSDAAHIQLETTLEELLRVFGGP